MSDKIWIDGMSVKKPREKAPEFVKATISFNVPQLIEWLQNSEEIINDKGYINIDLKESRKGNYYAEVNTYTPQGKSDPPPRKENYEDDDSIPF